MFWGVERRRPIRWWHLRGQRPVSRLLEISALAACQGGASSGCDNPANRRQKSFSSCLRRALKLLAPNQAESQRRGLLQATIRRASTTTIHRHLPRSTMKRGEEGFSLPFQTSSGIPLVGRSDVAGKPDVHHALILRAIGAGACGGDCDGCHCAFSRAAR